MNNMANKNLESKLEDIISEIKKTPKKTQTYGPFENEPYENNKRFKKRYGLLKECYRGLFHCMDDFFEVDKRGGALRNVFFGSLFAIWLGTTITYCNGCFNEESNVPAVEERMGYENNSDQYGVVE